MRDWIAGRTVGWLLAVLAGSAAAGTEPDETVRNTAERVQDHAAVARDRRSVTDDTMDRDWTQAALDEYVESRARRDESALRGLDERVASHLAAESGEAARETAQAAAETRQSRREVRSDRRELRENHRESAPAVERADDHRDRRDDRRDRRDDRRDAAVEVAHQERLTAIRDEWVELAGTMEEKALDRKVGLLRELVALAGAEVRQGVVEGAEDRREVREDRRETREDRRDQ
jgi:hypothetical protein